MSVKPVIATASIDKSQIATLARMDRFAGLGSERTFMMEVSDVEHTAPFDEEAGTTLDRRLRDVCRSDRLDREVARSVELHDNSDQSV